MAGHPKTSPMKFMPPRPAGACEPAIKVWEHHKKGGWVLTFVGEQVHDIGSRHNDQISSVEVISGTWELFVHGEFKGKKIVLKKGLVPDLAALRMNDQISSLQAGRLVTDADSVARLQNSNSQGMVKDQSFKGRRAIFKG